MKPAPERILLIGFGNPCRQDDGLGPAVAAAVEQEGIPGVKVDSDYQLHVENAHAMAAHDVVIFVDADESASKPFYFRRVEPGGADSFSTHSVHPAGVVGLARDLFDSRARAYLLGIRGYAFEMFEEKMTSEAKANLAAALDFIKPLLREGSFDSALVDDIT